MTAGRVILWRHGQTEFNRAGRIQGHTDTPLDQAGRRQVAEAAGVIGGLKPDLIISSDLSRARATAEALGLVTGLDVRLDERLRERNYGQWEGLDGAELAARWPVEYARWRDGQDIPEVGMEPRPVAARRGLEAIEQAAAALGHDQTLVVASHGGIITTVVAAMLGLDPATWLGVRVLGNAHWAVMLANAPRQPAWRVAAYDLSAPTGEPTLAAWM